MSQPIRSCHVVAIPYPGRGHINPMLSLCRLILRCRPDFLVSFVVTEEWLGFLRLAPPTPNLNFHGIPNVIPSEIGRAKDFAGFVEAVSTKMEAPVERLLDQLPLPKPSVVMYDAYLNWVMPVGSRRNIPVAAVFPMSATVFSIFHHLDVIRQNGHFFLDSSEQPAKEQIINYIPGIPCIRLGDLPSAFHGEGYQVLPQVLKGIKLVSKAQYLLFTSIDELEPQVLDSLRKSLPNKIYCLGLSIPYFNIMDGARVDEEKPEYMKWLDSQPICTVLYISQGSFLSVSNAQLDEIIAGLCASGIRFLWVGRGEDLKMDTDNGIVVPWCDQLKVLCHPSVGGFWSHCGWNSTKEGAFAGLPMLTFPIFWDQVTNSKIIVEDWRIGIMVKKEDEGLVRKEDVTRLVLTIMDTESEEAKDRRRRARKIQDICRKASTSGGSSDMNILAFIQNISDIDVAN